VATSEHVAVRLVSVTATCRVQKDRMAPSWPSCDMLSQWHGLQAAKLQHVGRMSLFEGSTSLTLAECVYGPRLQPHLATGSDWTVS
jgi:hypothetical protein